MTIAESAALYTEVIKSVTPEEKIDRALAELDAAKGKLKKLPVSEMVKLVQRSLDDMIAVSRDWELAGCEAKGLIPGTELGCEEIQTGPLATARYLRLLMQSLKDIESEGSPRLPGEIVTGPTATFACKSCRPRDYLIRSPSKVSKPMFGNSTA